MLSTLSPRDVIALMNLPVDRVRDPRAIALAYAKLYDQRGGTVEVEIKEGKDYIVPMNEDVRNVMLQLRREANGSDYVFINPETGDPYVDLKRAFSTACRLAGIKNLHWHDLRHTFGTRLAEAGYSEAVIAELMGHSDPKTTRRYTHGTERGKRAAVEAIRVSGGQARPISAPQEERRPVLAAVMVELIGRDGEFLNHDLSHPKRTRKLTHILMP